MTLSLETKEDVFITVLPIDSPPNQGEWDEKEEHGVYRLYKHLTEEDCDRIVQSVLQPYDMGLLGKDVHHSRRYVDYTKHWLTQGLAFESLRTAIERIYSEFNFAKDGIYIRGVDL